MWRSNLNFTSVKVNKSLLSINLESKRQLKKHLFVNFVCFMHTESAKESTSLTLGMHRKLKKWQNMRSMTSRGIFFGNKIFVEQERGKNEFLEQSTLKV